MAPLLVILSDLNLDFKVTGHGVITDAVDVLCAQLTRDLFAIAKFLSFLQASIHSGNFISKVRPNIN